MNTQAVDLPSQEELIAGLKEVHNTQTKFGSLTLFIVTIIIFFSSRIISTKWEEVFILILVLLFHELGHFAAMKALKYDDVKMFFIPFIGAAVSGKAKRETALKSCIVSMMGPFPGIVVGALLFWIFGLTNNYYLLKTAQVMLLLNAFNFLPIMPLDGGRFLDVLFIKMRVFRLLFALFGSIIFFALAISTQDFLLGLVGLFSIIAAFSNFKTHGIAKSIESEGINAASVEELFEDPTQFRNIIEKMRSKYLSLFEPKVLYKGIYNNIAAIINTIKFIPVGFLSKASLLIVYPLLLLMSIAVTFFFLAADFREKIAVNEMDNEKITYSERYIFSKLSSRIPVNQSLEYDGMGIGYSTTDSSIITDFFRYENGFRTGLWIEKNDSGDTIKKEIYERGKLKMRMVKTGKAWDTLSSKDLPFIQKAIAAIRETSQPVHSNYQHFEQD